MENNLVKTITKKKDSKGKDITYVNYYLVFENGKRVYVMARYIPTLNISDEEKKNQIEESNTRNATLLDAFADLVKTNE